MTLAMIPIDKIEVGTRLRDTSEAQVETLVASIAAVGLLNPITVYPRQVIDNGIMSDGYGIIAGAHRLEACKRLGLVEIEANVTDLSELERQIAECDENLCSTVLSKAERAMFVKRRKQAYEALHGSAKARGAHAANEAMGNSNANANLADAFTTDTAAKTGQSERAIQRDAERGSKISDRALSMLKGTNLDTGRYLDDLKTVPQNEQDAKVKADLEAAREKRKPVPPPTAPHNPMEAYNKWATEMNRVWSRAPQEWRDRWLSVIDVTVFDRSAA